MVQQAELIAFSWAKDVEARLTKGEQAYKLSLQPLTAFARYIESGTGTRANLANIREAALVFALNEIKSGKYPLALNHFAKQ